MQTTLWEKRPIKETDVKIEIYLAHEHFQLLEMLALEGGETVQQLMLRLILKEDFERHTAYDAVRGQYTLHQCYCSRCFLKGVARDTQKMPITRKLRDH
jgi:hypothetical protein